MLKRQSKIALQIILGGFILVAVAIGCNDSKTDSTTVTDTTKMDTANTKPVVIPDEPAK